MYNSFGWIQLGVNRKHLDVMDEEIQIQYDKLDIELYNKVTEKLEEIKNENEIVTFTFSFLNNLQSFLSIQHSRNHFSSRLRNFYSWVADASDGSHGILYEFDDEDKNFNPDKPYRIWRLIGNEFEECEETVLNEKYHKVNY